MKKRDYLFVDDFLNFIEKLITKQKNNFEIINCTYNINHLKLSIF